MAFMMKKKKVQIPSGNSARGLDSRAVCQRGPLRQTQAP